MTIELWQANLIALVSTVLAIKLFRPISSILNLVDTPCDRKQHTGEIPLIGGIAIYVSILLTILTAFSINDQLFYLLVSGTLIFIVGVVDDFRQLGRWFRMLVQILACVIMIKGTGIYVESLGHFPYYGELKLGDLGIPFTILAVVGLVNALNMIDGIDGLAGSMLVVAVVSILGFEALSGVYKSLDFLLVFLAALIPFLLNNLGMFSDRKVFLGDAGSMFLGFVLAWVLIELSQKHIDASNALNPVDVLWCVAIPVFDFMAVIYRRLKSNRSPFLPDRSHLHHILQDKGLSQRQTLLVILSFSIGAVAIGWMLSWLYPEASLICFVILFLLYFLWVRKNI